MANLKEMTREEAENYLNSLKRPEVINIAKEYLVSSHNLQKGKAFIIERILWNAFDFEKAHRIVRGY